MRRFLLFAVIVATVTLAGFWGGRKLCMLMWPGTFNPQQQWYFALGLSSQQAESLKRLEAAFRQKTDPLCMDICKERLALLKLMREPNVPQEAVHEQIEKIGQMQLALEKEIAAHILHVKQDLTPAQHTAYLNRIQQQLHDAIKQSGYGEILLQ